MKKTFILILSFIFYTQSGFAQVDHTLKSDEYTVLDNLNVLIDRNYSFSQILNDSTLNFKKLKQISAKGVNFYWVKYTIQNNSAYDKRFAIYGFPLFDVSLYSFNEDHKNWQETKGGSRFANNRTQFKYVSCTFGTNKATTFYLKVSVKDINHSATLITPSIGIEKESSIVSNRNTALYWWLATIAIVLAFLIYNLYWYLMIKEKVYLYYIITLLGGMVYITTANYFLSYFTNLKSINAVINSNGTISYIPVELIVMNFSIILILFGFVAFTRSYLRSKIFLPKWDKILTIAFQIFALTQFSITAFEYANILKPNDIYVNLMNVLTLIVIVTILAIGFKSYKKQKKESTYFLLALFLPLGLMISLLFSLLLEQEDSGLRFLPFIATLSITITFAIALLARVNLIKAALNAETLERQSIAASNLMEKERNSRLQEKIEYDKNEVEAAQKIKLLMKELHHRVKNNLQIVSSLLSLQSFRIKDQAAIDAVREGQNRIEAMSLIHQRLYVQDNITQVNIKDFISDIAESLMLVYGYEKFNFDLKIIVTEELLDVDKAIPLSIIINELITNALKYAFKGVNKAELRISFFKKFETATLQITDNGIGIDLQAWKENDGYGKDLVQTFTQQLDGQLTISIDYGTTFQIDFPV